MTRVVVANEYGGPEVLAIVDETVREPGPGEVLLDIRAAGVNPADLKAYGGEFGRHPERLPLHVGSEASGVVRAVGADAIGADGPVRVGDEVIAYRIQGGYAEQAVVPAASIVPRPSTLTWEQAGGLMLTGVTAAHTLIATAVGEGDTVLVHGAAGGVGTMAVQLTIVAGARVIGTASPASHEALRALGAEPVAYGDGLADRVRALAPEGIDAAIDTVGTDEALDVSLELVADRSRIATIANFGRGPAAGVKVLGGGPGADPGIEIRLGARLDLARLAERGVLTVVVDRVFPLDRVVAAHEYLRGGHAHGKVILIP